MNRAMCAKSKGSGNGTYATGLCQPLGHAIGLFVFANIEGREEIIAEPFSDAGQKALLLRNSRVMAAFWGGF